MRIIFIFALLLILLVTIFAVQNNTSIDIKLLFWKINGSLALVLVIAFILGILIGFLVSTPTAIRKHSQMAELRKKLHMVETDLEEARNAMAALSMEKPVQEKITEDTSAESHPAIQEQKNFDSTEG